MPQADIVPITSRRTLLGAIASPPVAVAAPATAAAEDPHVGWLRHCLEVRDQLNAAFDACDASDEEVNTAYAKVDAVRDRLLDTPSATVEGAAARLAMVVDALHSGIVYNGSVTTPILQNMADVLGLPHSEPWRAKPQLKVVAGGRA